MPPFGSCSVLDGLYTPINPVKSKMVNLVPSLISTTHTTLTPLHLKAEQTKVPICSTSSGKLFLWIEAWETFVSRGFAELEEFSSFKLYCLLF